VKYLLEDLSLKIQHKLPSADSASSRGKNSTKSVTSSSGTCFYSLDRLSIDEFFTSMETILPILCARLEAIHNMVSKAEEDDSEITDEALVKQSFSLIVLCITSLFSWNGFKEVANRDQLKRIAKCIASREVAGDIEGDGLALLLANTGAYLARSGFVLNKLSVAVSVVKLLDGLASLTLYNDVICKRVREMAGEVLSITTWKEKAAEMSDHLVFLLRKRFESLEDGELLDALEHYVGNVLKALVTENEAELEKNVFLTKETFATYYKVCSLGFYC
jgi:hypothetical protein